MLVKGAPGRCQEVHLSRRRWPEDRFRWCNALVYHSDMGDRWSGTWHQRPRLAARARPSGLIMRRKLSYQARKLSQNNYSSLSCVNLCFFSFQKPQRRVCGVVARRWSFSGHRLQTGMASRHAGFRKWLVACSAPCHHQMPWWLIASQTFMGPFQCDYFKSLLKKCRLRNCGHVAPWPREWTH